MSHHVKNLTALYDNLFNALLSARREEELCITEGLESPDIISVKTKIRGLLAEARGLLESEEEVSFERSREIEEREFRQKQEKRLRAEETERLQEEGYW